MHKNSAATTQRVVVSFLPVLLAAAVTLSGCSFVRSTNSASTEPYIAGANFNNQVVRDRIGRHIYAGTGIGASNMEPDTSEVPLYDVNDRVEPGGQITLGMDLSRQLSVELHSADLGSAGLSPNGRINYHIHGASALIYAGKNRHNFKRRGLTGYGRLGVGYLENSAVGDVPFVKDNAVHVLFGAGVEYMTRVGLGLRAEGIAYEEDAQYAQLGVIYRTGRKPKPAPVELVEAPPIIEHIIEEVPVAAAQPEYIPEPVAYNPCESFDGVLEGVNFHTDKAELIPSAQQILDGVAQTLSECPGVPVSISAHTDSVGSGTYNQALSKRRARSVAGYLTSRGVDIDRLSAYAFGESQPIDTNDTAEGRSRNRRVELIAR